MTRLTRDEWTTIRQQYETDPRLSFGELAEKYGVSKQAIHKRATTERWVRVLSLAELNARAQTRADHLVDGRVDAQTLASTRKAGVDEATERRAAVLDRHRKEADGPRKLVYEAIKSNDLEKAKLAKAAAETMRIVQELERKAWGLDAGESNGAAVIVIDRS